MNPRLSERQTAQAAQIKRDFELCSEMLDEYFEPRRLTLHRRLALLLYMRRGSSAATPVLLCFVLLRHFVKLICCVLAALRRCGYALKVCTVNILTPWMI